MRGHGVGRLRPVTWPGLVSAADRVVLVGCEVDLSGGRMELGGTTAFLLLWGGFLLDWARLGGFLAENGIAGGKTAVFGGFITRSGVEVLFSVVVLELF